MADGLAREGFDIDLRFGQERELTFAEVLLIRDGHFLELKSDQRARSTGNVFVEYRQHGRPSGIATTDSHWWTVEVEDDVFVTMPTRRMRALASAAVKSGRKTMGGDGNAYEGALVRVEDLVLLWREAA